MAANRKSFLLVVGLIFNVALVLGAEKTFSFQNLSGKGYTNVALVKVESDAILIRYGDSYKYERIKFSDMSTEVQLSFGYDIEKMKRAEQLRVENAKAQAEARKSSQKRQQEELARDRENSIWSLAFKIAPLKPSDLPSSEAALATCKQILAELNGVNTVIQHGVSLNKYSDLITDMTVKIQKLKDMSPTNLPIVIITKVDKIVELHHEAEKNWRDAIFKESETVKEWNEFDRQEAWSEVGLIYSQLSRMMEGKTSVEDSQIDRLVRMVRSEERALKNIQRSYTRYHSLYGLSDDELKSRIKDELKSFQ